MSCHNYFVLSLVALLAIGNSSGKAPRRGAYHVSLQREYKHMCSGALISKRHVITAAKCLVDYGGRHHKEGLTIITNVGSTRIGGSQRHSASFVQIHPDFFKGNASNHPRNDIAVITLNPEVLNSSTAEPIALPLDNNIDSKQFAHFSGRGVNIFGIKSCIGKTLNLYIGERWYCEDDYHIDHSQLCTKHLKYGGTCEGDEGGPLEHHSVVVGILSYRIGECNDGSPEVYTRVASYTNFIEEAMRKRRRRFKHKNGPISNKRTVV